MVRNPDTNRPRTRWREGFIVFPRLPTHARHDVYVGPLQFRNAARSLKYVAQLFERLATYLALHSSHTLPRYACSSDHRVRTHFGKV